MKPDQHKKKRSAQYKKKHGVKSGEAKEERKAGKSTVRVAGTGPVTASSRSDGGAHSTERKASDTVTGVSDEEVLEAAFYYHWGYSPPQIKMLKGY